MEKWKDGNQKIKNRNNKEGNQKRIRDNKMF
jgi:hypothetical protein